MLSRLNFIRTFKPINNKFRLMDAMKSNFPQDLQKCDYIYINSSNFMRFVHEYKRDVHYMHMISSMEVIEKRFNQLIRGQLTVRTFKGIINLINLIYMVLAYRLEDQKHHYNINKHCRQLLKNNYKSCCSHSKAIMFILDQIETCYQTYLSSLDYQNRYTKVLAEHISNIQPYFNSIREESKQIVAKYNRIH